MKILTPQRKSQVLFLILLCAILPFNFVVMRQRFIRMANYHKVIPHQHIGYKFEGLQKVLKNVEVMGYFTDKSLDDPEQAKLFSHAQFAIAPTMLEFNSLDHEYILFVCSDERIAWKIIKEINGMALNRNRFGMILVKRK